MTEPLQFVVGGTPIPAARPRFDRRSGRTYTDARSVQYRRHVAGIAGGALLFENGSGTRRREPPWPSPEQCARARARLLGKRKRPKCACSWCSAEFRLELLIVLPDRRTRDLDNIEKNILDACTGVLWLDDRQAFVEKKDRAFNKARPRVEVIVRPAVAQVDMTAAREGADEFPWRSPA